MMLLLLALRAQTQTDEANKEAEQALPTNHESPVQIYKARRVGYQHSVAFLTTGLRPLFTCADAAATAAQDSAQHVELSKGKQQVIG